MLQLCDLAQFVFYACTYTYVFTQYIDTFIAMLAMLAMIAMLAMLAMIAMLAMLAFIATYSFIAMLLKPFY